MSCVPKPARFSRRDFLLGSGALAAVATVVGLRRQMALRATPALADARPPIAPLSAAGLPSS